MILQGYEDWPELFEKFPSQTINEIDRLWVKYSKGHFGISVQKRIWQSVGGKQRSDYFETMKNFGEQVEWYVRGEDEWIDYRTIPFTNKKEGNLPGMIYWRQAVERLLGGSWVGMGYGWDVTVGMDGQWVVFDRASSSLFSLLSRQDLTYKI